MSVYGGFATRKQEAFYSKLVAKLLHLFTQKILSTIPYNDIVQFLVSEPDDDILSQTNFSGVDTVGQDSELDAHLASLRQRCDDADVKSSTTTDHFGLKGEGDIMKFFKHLKMPSPAAYGGAPLSEASNDSKPYQS